MLLAEIKGKLGRALTCADCRSRTDATAYSGFEDVLTSNVFGALRYLEPRWGVGPVLAGCDLAPIDSADLEFWPYADGCEPDVVIDLGHTIVLVEAKLNADFGPDQLPREVLFAHRRADGRPWRVLCVTPHARPPLHAQYTPDRRPMGDRGELRAAVASYFAEHDETGLGAVEIARRISWMSWGEVGERLRDARLAEPPPSHAAALIDDLCRALEARGLTWPRYQGFASVPHATSRWTAGPVWSAAEAGRAPSTDLEWAIPPMIGRWRAPGWFASRDTFEGFGRAKPGLARRWSGWFSRGGNHGR